MLKLIKKYKYVITFFVIVGIILFCFIRSKKLKDDNIVYTNLFNEEEVNSGNFDNEKEIEIEVNRTITIDIKGQVVNPGVYILDEGARVIDAVDKAGGLTDIANTSLINLSKKLEDQMVVIIYSNDEVANSNVKEIKTVFKVIEKECNCPNIKNDSCINTELGDDNKNIDEEGSELININTASLEKLMELSGIGESKANSIIEYRKKSKFVVIEDIMNVSGISETLFEKIKVYITV